MRNFRLLALAAALLVCSCGEKAYVRGTIEGAPDTQILVRQLNSRSPMDTIVTGRNGSFRFSFDVKKGEPEFIYLYKGETKLVSLLLEAGERVKVQADTLGHYTTRGSEGSLLLARVEEDFAGVNRTIQTLQDAGAPAKDLTKAYIDYYRSAMKFALENSKSMAVIPLMYGNLGGVLPVFSQETDAILFRMVCDSLKTVYPKSRYVASFEKETARRENILELRGRIGAVEARDYPELLMPGMDGKPVSLSGLFEGENPAKAVLVHFWVASDANIKMLNIDTLLPLYEKWHPRGLEIYAVCLSPDKVEWGSVVKSQALPWVNVNDGKGTTSPSIALYNVNEIPSSVLVAPGTVYRISGVDALEKEFARLLK